MPQFDMTRRTVMTELASLGSEADRMTVLSLREAEDLVVRTLARARTSAENAGSVARALVAAEADGLKGHGLSRLPSYAAQAKVGKVDGFANPMLTRARPGLLAIDAANGFAFPALELAVAALPEVARGQGVAAAAIRRSHHCGAAGHTVERLAEAGLVALMFVNTPAAMAPWGGSKAVLGTNPIAFACPLAGRAPLVIDLSLSKVARGNIVGAKQRGEKIPDGWALDEHGEPTTDPDAALRGTMVPSGEAKGTALALMVELLAAGLTGANFAAEASSYLDAKGPPPGTGQLIITFDPSAFGGDAIARFASLASSIARQDGARLPGARRLAARAKAAIEGLELSEALLAEIKTV
jgi:(2R)-3-sulfolactate dehydrogenase (NADP+)